jgi:ribosomal protein L40E
MMLLDGWKRADVIRVYAHLSMRDVENKDLTLHGLKRREEVLRPLTEIRVCQRCKHENAPIAVYCQECGAILATVTDSEEVQNLREELQSQREEVKQLRGQFETILKTKFGNET